MTGSRCTALGRAISLPFLSPSRRSSTFGVFSASIRSCPGRLRWRVSVPWPYSTAGTLPSRRLRRAAPLPNSVRVSAAILTSGTVLLLVSTCDAGTKCSRQMRRARMQQRRLAARSGSPAANARLPSRTMAFRLREVAEFGEDGRRLGPGFAGIGRSADPVLRGAERRQGSRLPAPVAAGPVARQRLVQAAKGLRVPAQRQVAAAQDVQGVPHAVDVVDLGERLPGLP